MIKIPQFIKNLKNLIKKPHEPLRTENRELTVQDIQRAIIETARLYVGIKEQGHNKGKIIEEFQKAVDGRAMGEPYCLGFVQYVVNEVCRQFGLTNPLYQTEHCQTLFNGTLQNYKTTSANCGHIFIMKSHNSNSGHAGFCVNAGNTYFATIEGNTNPDGSREGDGVYEKIRHMGGTKTMNIRGFIDLSKMIYNEKQKQNAPQRLA